MPTLPENTTVDDIRNGDALFHGKGGCVNCHGSEATGLAARGSSLTGGLHLIESDDLRGIDSIIVNGIATMEDAVAHRDAAARSAHKSHDDGDPRARRICVGAGHYPGRTVARWTRAARCARPECFGAERDPMIAIAMLQSLTRANGRRRAEHAGCGGAGALSIARFGTGLIVAATIVFVVVLVLLVWPIIRRNDPSRNIPDDRRDGVAVDRDGRAWWCRC